MSAHRRKGYLYYNDHTPDRQWLHKSLTGDKIPWPRWAFIAKFLHGRPKTDYAAACHKGWENEQALAAAEADAACRKWDEEQARLARGPL